METENYPWFKYIKFFNNTGREAYIKTGTFMQTKPRTVNILN